MGAQSGAKEIAMKNAPMDEPLKQQPEGSDQADDSEAPVIPASEVAQPGIVAGVGSSALGSTDVDEEEVEPQRRRHPDNDGETVEG
jgi:hypothetical protein